MNSNGPTFPHRMVIRRIALVMVLINFTVAISFLVIARRQVRQMTACLIILESEQQKIQQVRDELNTCRQQVEILAMLDKRAVGIDEQDYQSLARVMIEQSRLYGYSPELLLALIQVESSFNNYAVSDKGAIGLMQLQPETAEYLCSHLDLSWQGPHTLFDPHLNIRLGTYYLSLLHERFQDLNCALEAYNKGPSRVSTQLASGLQVQGVFSRDIDRYHLEFKKKIGRI
ncbi:lytic transglycosylase domain-containing protein [bacterium]|nr:lytic transglycosylase domain-containing protein [bacterium]